jgi:hypothetical protein
MNAIMTKNHARVGASDGKTATTPASEYVCLARSSLLSELPGAVFGLLTAVYIVGSFLSLV